MASQRTPELGNLIRLMPLTLEDIPSHPSFPNTSQSNRPGLVPFIKAILSEATTFVDETLPKTFSEGSEKSSSPSAAKIRVLKRHIPSADLSRIPWTESKISRRVNKDVVASTSENWFARRSRHVNRSEKGTADFHEFDEGLRIEHSEREREYTPDLFDSYKVLDWDAETTAIGDIDNFLEPRMTIYEMCHQLPFPLSTRVFSVLVVTAKTGRDEFVVVQAPVDIHSLPQAFYSNGRNTREGDSALKRKTPVLGVYISIERCRISPDQKIEWLMATASDAKGWLPMWAQKLGLPGAIVKDVGYLMTWVLERRGIPGLH